MRQSWNFWISTSYTEKRHHRMALPSEVSRNRLIGERAAGSTVRNQGAKIAFAHMAGLSRLMAADERRSEHAVRDQSLGVDVRQRLPCRQPRR